MVNSYFENNGKEERIRDYKENHNGSLAMGLKHSRPEQWQVVEWFRVNHGYWVDVHRIGKKFQVGVECMNTGNSIWSNDTDYDKPQEAYSAAFDYILKELI